MRQTFRLYNLRGKISYLSFFLFHRKKIKVFCIGRNKTGTTSMKILFKKLGYFVAPQKPAEKLLKDWGNKDFNRLISFVKRSGNFFQDIPFSLPETYKIMNETFPNSKFILTIRDSPEVWYQSLTKFHSKKLGISHLPLGKDLMNHNYVYKGWLWEANRLIYNTPETDIYNEEILKKHYQDHNDAIIKYFEDKPEKLLVINLKEENVIEKICRFIGAETTITSMPWANKTSN